MSNYTKTTDFAAKDALPTGDSAKIIRGSDFETEFDAISTAITSKAESAGPTFTGTLTFETISDGTIAVTAFVDEDDMTSNSATLVPTQQSVKAYVDSQVTAQDLDFQADSGGALSIDLDSETLTFTGGTGIDTSGSGNAVTFAIDSTVATLTGTQTLTNKTLTSPDVNTPDIDGGTIDGTVIGGATPAAVSATTVSATGNITVGGTVDGRDVATDGSKLDGIEASADVTDTANVTAAGALMDSELTDITAVKALNQGVATTDSPTFAGLTTTADVSFGDNDKAIFGAGSDLQIYHNASDSIINDNGTGSLKLQTGASTKLEVTSTGIDVTGTVTADGLTVDGGNTLRLNAASTNDFFTIVQGGTQAVLTADSDAAANMLFKTATAGTDKSRMLIASGGDISFYEDTGTTAKLFWDSSAEALGIGSTSPSAPIDVVTNSTAYVGEFTQSNTSNGDGVFIQVGSNASADYALTVRSDAGNTSGLAVKADGKVGIGVFTPAHELDVNGTVDAERLILDSETITSSSNAATIDLSTGDNFVHDLTENVTYTFSNPGASGKISAFSLKVIQGSTARTITWPSSVDWAGGTAPTLSTANNAVDIFVFFTNDGGTIYYGFTAGQAMA